MLMSLAVAGCVIAGLIFVAGIIGLFIVISLNDPDTVSGARQGWLYRRSEKDDQGW